MATFRGCGPWAKFRFSDPSFLVEDFMMSSASSKDSLAAMAKDVDESLEDVEG